MSQIFLRPEKCVLKPSKKKQKPYNMSLISKRQKKYVKEPLNMICTTYYFILTTSVR